MGRIVINQTDEKLVIILETAADDVSGSYIDSDGVTHPVGGITYKTYKVKAKTAVQSGGNLAIPVFGTLENYRGWDPVPLTALFISQNQSGLGTSASIIANNTASTAYLTNGTTGATETYITDSVRLVLYIPEGNEEIISTFLEEVEE